MMGQGALSGGSDQCTQIIAAKSEEGRQSLPAAEEEAMGTNWSARNLIIFFFTLKDGQKLE